MPLKRCVLTDGFTGGCEFSGSFWGVDGERGEGGYITRRGTESLYNVFPPTSIPSRGVRDPAWGRNAFLAPQLCSTRAGREEGGVRTGLLEFSKARGTCGAPETLHLTCTPWRPQNHSDSCTLPGLGRRTRRTDAPGSSRGQTEREHFRGQLSRVAAQTLWRCPLPVSVRRGSPRCSARAGPQGAERLDLDTLPRLRSPISAPAGPVPATHSGVCCASFRECWFRGQVQTLLLEWGTGPGLGSEAEAPRQGLWPGSPAESQVLGSPVRVPNQHTRRGIGEPGPAGGRTLTRSLCEVYKVSARAGRGRSEQREARAAPIG